jgi:hypothetical protein
VSALDANGERQRAILCGHLEAALEAGLDSMPSGLCRDVYVLGLILDEEGRDEDERRPRVSLGWNTRAYLRGELGRQNRTELSIYSPWEWLEPAAIRVFDTTADPRGAALRKAWLEAAGLWYEDEDRETALDELGGEIWDRFVDIVIEAISTLRASGRLQALLGREVPVHVLAPDYDEEERIELNRRANPPQLHSVVDRWSEELRIGPLTEELVESAGLPRDLH